VPGKKPDDGRSAPEAADQPQGPAEPEGGTARLPVVGADADADAAQGAGVPPRPAEPPQPTAQQPAAQQPAAGFGAAGAAGGAGGGSAAGNAYGPGGGGDSTWGGAPFGGSAGAGGSGSGGVGGPGGSDPSAGAGAGPGGGPGGAGAAFGSTPHSGPGGGAPGGPYDPWSAPPAPGGPPPKRGRISGGLVAAAVAIALVAGGVGGGIGFLASQRGDSGDTTTITSGSDTKTLNRSPKSVAGIAAKALPSVVTIETSGGGEKGTGTGFVYDKEGHILTNNHVVSSAAQGGSLTATFSDGKKYDAEIVGRAQGYDVAVIKLKNAGGRKLTPLALGKSNDVQVGDATIAIGAPYGLSGTVTTGIVSAKNRPVASSDGGQGGSGSGGSASYMNALQTDASINPGNSGGPLLDAQGNVIGVNSAIRSGGGTDPFGGQQSTGSVGLGFAIPINQAKWVAETLIKTGKPVYAQVGVIPDPEYTGVGARIRQSSVQGQPPVTPGGPADKAGLKAGDVITKLGDHTITGYEDLFSEIWSHKPGEKIKITYLRDGKEATTELTLGQREGDQ